ARQLDLAVGAELDLAPPPRAPITRCIDGKRVTIPPTERPSGPQRVKVKGILSHHALARRHQGLVVVGSFALARRTAPHAISYYQVNRRPGANPDLLKRSLQDDFQVLDKRSAMLGEGADERAFRNGVKMLGLLALVMGMLVVFQTLSQTLLERLRQIGLMRCLGASRRAVASIFLVDGLLLALLGVACGTALGIGLAWGMAAMRWTTLGLGKEILTFEIPPQPVLLAAGLGVFFTLAGSAFPLWKARNLPPVQVLQARGLGDTGYLLRGVNLFLFVLLVVVLPLAYLAMTPLLSEEGRETRLVLLQVAAIVMLFGGLLLVAPRLIDFGGRLVLRPLRRVWPLPVFLVEKAVHRSPGRFAAAVCGLAVVLVAMVALKHITYALRAEVRQFSAAAMDGRLYFFDAAPRTAADLRGVHTLPGVRSAELIAGVVDAGFLLRGLSADALLRDGAPFAGRPELAAQYRATRTLVVSHRWSELHNKQVGQQVQLLTGSGVQRYTILAVSDAVGFFPDERVWALAAPEFLAKDFCTEQRCVDRLTVHLADGADPGAVRQAVAALFPHAKFKRGDDVRDYLIRDVTRDFFLFDVLLLLILGLVTVGLVNTMTIAAVGRAREIGVLRALGMSDKQLKRAFVVEGLLVAVLSAVVAIAMGLPLGYVVVEGLNRVTGLAAPVVIPWPYVGVVPLAALLAGWIASLLPGSRAVKMNPVEAVRYE
ncbi:MAG: FtsX-like permease family protein, partial [Planctomycetes bacterium]|nr:FtsX-like permease family protein [Planctomycetota bacterium]